MGLQMIPTKFPRKLVPVLSKLLQKMGRVRAGGTAYLPRPQLPCC